MIDIDSLERMISISLIVIPITCIGMALFFVLVKGRMQ